MKIGGRSIGPQVPPFVIAEMSGNHSQSLERALDIVDAAAAAGAHGFKIQTYTADTMTLPLSTGDFFIDDEDSLWHGQSLHDLYQVAFTPWEWHAAIFERARERGLVAFSTPFDESAVDFLEDLEVPCYKIASFENAHLPLIRKVASTGKPLVVSTGMATLSELDETVRTARTHGCRDLILLKCTSTYPASPENTNIRTIPHLRELFDCEVGLSDHTLGVGAAVASVALGATVIEKHFTLDRADGGVDSAFSMEPAEMRALVEETERAWQALGGIRYGPLPAEASSMRFRRSVYIAQDVSKGDVLTTRNLRVVRPGYGLPPRHFGSLLGLRVTRDLPMGTAMRWEYLG
ncbi:MAG: pseudaminic acid synthase [Gemmatimonadales bacterium]|nr:MAG: pseudaminic acid synthase [Gemmatimonadales bacterium]